MVERVPDRGTFCILAFLALWLFTSGSVAAVAISNPPLGQQTGQRSILNSVGTARLPEAPDSAKRPFRIAAYFRFRDEEREDVVQHVRETIVPTITSLLGRWIRVRFPSGPLNFSGILDRDSEAIPPGPEINGAYDADLVLKVRIGDPLSEECRFAAVTGTAVLFDDVTQRTTFGQLLTCRIIPEEIDLINTLQYVMHEMMHILGFQMSLYRTFLSVARQEDIVQVLPESERVPASLGTRSVGPEFSIISPNALREARMHFGCPAMDKVLLGNELFGGGPDPPEHWSLRHQNGEVMMNQAAESSTHWGRLAITNITLALLQDSGWYDVKYGSAGFNSYGYRGGCTFVFGTFDEVLADPVASRFVCPPEEIGTIRCFDDYSGQGVCRPLKKFDQETYEDLFVVDTSLYQDDSPGAAVIDCQGSPGSRCLNVLDDDGDQQLICTSGFMCSSTGQVLFEGGIVCGEVLEPSDCPPDDLMCDDPGFLTCAGPELNDCNGRGDCLKGRCYCHLGFGGDDCTVPVCTTGCPDGSACPASGFCGIPECGEWSVGDTGVGVPCTRN